MPFFGRPRFGWVGGCRCRVVSPSSFVLDRSGAGGGLGAGGVVASIFCWREGRRGGRAVGGCLGAW
jgi:hypothetical protein